MCVLLEYRKNHIAPSIMHGMMEEIRIDLTQAKTNLGTAELVPVGVPASFYEKFGFRTIYTVLKDGIEYPVMICKIAAYDSKAVNGEFI